MIFLDIDANEYVNKRGKNVKIQRHDCEYVVWRNQML